MRDKISQTAKDDEALLSQGKEDDKGLRDFSRIDAKRGF